MQMVRQVWPWVRPYRGFVTASLVGTVISIVVNLVIPLLTSRIIDRGVAGQDSGYVVRTAVVMIVLIVVGMAASAFSSAMGVRLANNSVTDLRQGVFAHTQTLSFANLDLLASGEILTRITSDMTRIAQLLAMGVGFVAQMPITFVGALIAIIAIDASLLVVVAVMVPIIVAIVAYTTNRSSVLYDLVQGRIDRLNTVLQESIHGAEVIKAFVRQDHEVGRIDRVTDDLATRSIAVNRLVASLFPTLTVIASLGIAAVVWLGGGNVIDGSLTEGELVAFLSYMMLITFPMMMFAFLQPMISAATASMQRVDEILRAEPDLVDPVSPLPLPAGPLSVEFDNVDFSYHASPEPALSDVSFSIPAGSTVAILGATGSGKSTLTHLIPRFYDPTGGRVLIGGVDARDSSMGQLRSRVAIALQQPQLFAGTIAENLRFARPDASDDEMTAAATAAQAHDFVVATGDGYEAHVAQGGANLSGGQRQRLALARALLADPSVLVLDDSTSAVDLDTEARIQDALAELDCTVVIVAQRISTALGADEIIVLDDGRVAACGAHHDLLATSDLYRSIYRSQLGEPAR